MISPSCEKIEELAKTYNTIPVSREIFADITTPILLLRKLSLISGRYYLLESVEGGEKWGRYSFLGYDPVLRVTCKDSVVTIEGKDSETIKTDKPLTILRKILSRYHAPRLSDLPPFTGGFVGYFAYNMIGYAEPVLKLKKGDGYDFDLMLFDKVIAYDHLKQKICVIVNMSTDCLMENYGKAVAELEGIASMIRGPQPEPGPRTAAKAADFTSSVDFETYCTRVEKTKEYIVDGDIFQAVISRRFESTYEGSLLNAYRVLRTTNPSPYMVFMHIR